MKNKSSKLLVLSLAALLGVACSPIVDNSSSEKIGESILVDQDPVEEDEIGVAVPLRKDASSTSTSTAKIGYNFGFQKIDEEDGKISVRFVAALSGINDVYAVKIKRSVVDGNDVSVMAEKTLSVDKVYSSLKNASSISWDGENGSLDADDTYYAVYTLKNIPEAHFDDVISVEFSIERWSGASLSASTKANGTSFLHAVTEIAGLTFVAGSSSNDYVKADEVYVNATASTASTLTEVEIPEKVYVAASSSQKHVVKEATVVCIGNPSYTGYASYAGQGFSQCTNLKKITLPKTIRTFGNYVFNCCSLDELELPEGLTLIQDQALGYIYRSSSYSSSTTDCSCGIKKLIWNAKALADAPLYNPSSTYAYAYGMINWTLDKVIMGEKVESLPNFKLFGGQGKAYLPAEVEWKITEAQKSALAAAYPNADIFSVSNYVCSDTAKVSVNYHLGEGTLELDGAEQTGDYTNEVYAGGGRTLAKPESPTPASGYKFTGWFLDEGYANEAVFPITLGEEDVSLYAKYEVAAAGEVASNPKALALGDAFTFSTSESIPANYFSFTATKEGSDYYYFEISDFTQAEDSPNSRLNYSTNLWAYKTSDFATPLTVNRSGPYTSEVNGYNNYQISVLLAKGETIYIKAAAFDTTDSSPKPVYGDITLKVWDYDGDTAEEAIEITNEVPVSFTSNKSHQDYMSTFYKFTATQASYKLTATQLGSHKVTAKVKVFDDETMKTSKGSFSISSSEAFCLLSGLTVGSTYYIEIESNYLSTFAEGDGISLTLGDLPAGLSEDNPLKAELGSRQEIVDMSAQTRYYSYNLEAGKTYYVVAKRTGSGNNSAATGAYSLKAVGETSTAATGKIWTLTYGDYSKNVTLTPSSSGEYVFSVDVATSSSWNASYHMTEFAIVEQKSGFDAEATYEDGAYICIVSTAKAVWNLNVSLANEAEGETAKLGLLTSSLSFPTDASSIYSGNATITLAGSTYANFYQVSTSNGEDAKITASLAPKALEGKPYVDKQFNGGYTGSSSYWKVTIDGYGTASGEGTFRASNGVTVSETSEADGIYELAFNCKGTTTKGYTDGTRLYANVNGQEWYASNAISYSSSIAFKTAKTSDYVAGDTNPETGARILSIVENETRIYCLVLGSKVYLNATVEFESGDISTSGSKFTVKDGEMVLGTYSISGEVLTVVSE